MPVMRGDGIAVNACIMGLGVRVPLPGLEPGHTVLETVSSLAEEELKYKNI